VRRRQLPARPPQQTRYHLGIKLLLFFPPDARDPECLSHAPPRVHQLRKWRCQNISCQQRLQLSGGTNLARAVAYTVAVPDEDSLATQLPSRNDINAHIHEAGSVNGVVDAFHVDNFGGHDASDRLVVDNNIGDDSDYSHRFVVDNLGDHHGLDGLIVDNLRTHYGPDGFIVDNLGDHHRGLDGLIVDNFRTHHGPDGFIVDNLGDHNDFGHIDDILGAT